MPTIDDVTTTAQAYAQTRYDQGKADQRTVDQPVIDQLNAQVTQLEADETADEATIAQLRATIAGLSARFPGDPGLGRTLVGLSTAGGDPSAREKLWGATAGAFRSYFQWDQNPLIAGRAARDLAAGTLPSISFKDSGRWASIAAGADDALLDDLMTRLAALEGPVELAMHHEPVDDTATEGTPEDFGAANLHLMGMIPPNVALVPIVQSAPFDVTVGGNPATLARWLPDGSYTFVGIDTYNHRHYRPTAGGKYRDAATCLSFLDVVRATLGKPDLPIAIAEFGVRTDPANPGKAAGWLRDFVALAATKNVPSVCYFDSGMNVNDGGTPWSLDYAGDGTDGRERVTAYGQLVAAGAHLTA